jgi:methylmalonyl-CoA/ethylmalonyl-CoA epimerase
MPLKINHIAIVVADIEKALELYQATLGLSLAHIAEEEAEQVRIAFLPAANGEIELIQPTTANSGVAKFLAKRGEGLHHICLEVDDIDTTLRRMAARGLEVLGDPRLNERGEKYVFIHPKSAHGVLLELYERKS